MLVAAGGDGTLSAVAGVAVGHDVPLVVVPCGTRNHFAKDCGADITDRRVVAPEQVLVVLVSNNAYSPGVAPSPALRPRLDEGMLWVYLLGLPGADRPLTARLVRGTDRLVSGRALVAAWPTTQQTMTTDTPSIPVGVDGEAAELNTPLEFTVRPRALRLLQPSRNEPVDRHFSLRW